MSGTRAAGRRETGARPLRVARALGRGLKRLPRPPWRAVLVVAVAAAALSSGWLWLRDASVVRVERVFITGTSSSEERAIRNALRETALDMTTLHVREDQLRTAVEPYRSVADLRVKAGFPHKLSIEVIEHRPVAIVLADGAEVPVSGGGLLLNGVEASDGLPTLRMRSGSGGGPRVRDRRTLAGLAVVAVAPEELLARAERIWWGERGMAIDLRNGPDLIFGSRAGAGTKWAAAARVLAEPAAQGATYLDLRVPERVAAGGLAEVREEEPEDVAGQATPGAAGQAPPGTSEAAPAAPSPEPQTTPTPAAP